MDTTFYINFFVALFAILNPLGNLPVFIGATGNETSGVQRAMAVLLCLFMVIFLLIFLFTGEFILNFFGISLPAFRIAGGIIILLMGINMIRGHMANVHGDTGVIKGGDFQVAESRLSNVLVPLGVPIFVGPGSISTIIVYADKAKGFGEMSVMAVLIFIATLVVLAILVAGNWIGKLLGRQGLDIATRILGLILCAIAIQFILEGIGGATVDIINPEILKR